jgi:hypothetical protein
MLAGITRMPLVERPVLLLSKQDARGNAPAQRVDLRDLGNYVPPPS